MNQIHKHPLFYYVVFPVAVAMWPLFIATIYLPRAESKWKQEQGQYEKAQQIIAGILTKDPDRLKSTGEINKAGEFDYAAAINKIAALYAIPPENYQISSGIMMSTAGQKSQSAKVLLKQIDIKRFANFLSTMQVRWANLQCTQVKLTKKKGLPDKWDIDLDFKYYY